MLKAVIPVKSQDILAIFQNQASFGTQNPWSERNQVARKTQILTVMSFWSFPKRARAIYLGNSTLRKGKDPDILRTVGHRVQADVNSQSPGIASWYPVWAGPRPMSQKYVWPLQSHRISHLEDSNCRLIPGLRPRCCPLKTPNIFLNKGPCTVSLCWVAPVGLYEEWSSGSGVAYSASVGSADTSVGFLGLSRYTWNTYAQ